MCGIKPVVRFPAPESVQGCKAKNMACDSVVTQLLHGFTVPKSFGDPTQCAAWFDDKRHMRACIAHYGNGRQAIISIGPDGRWETTIEPIEYAVKAEPEFDRMVA